MAKRKITRKQLLKEPDEFISVTSRILQWCRLHPRQLTYAGLAIIAVVIVALGLKTYDDHRSRKAFTLLSQGISGIKAMEGQDASEFSSVEPEFNRLLSSFKRQSAGRLGRIIYAHAQLTRGSADESIDLYQKALADYRQDPSLAAILHNGLASAYEQKAMNQEAIQQYEKIVQGSGSVLKDSALFQLGRLYRLTGAHEKSSQAYLKLAEEYPQSIYTPMAAVIPTS